MFEAPTTRFMKVLAVVLLLGMGLGIVALHLLNPSRSARLTMLERDHARMQTLVAREKRDNSVLEQELRSLEGGAGWYDVARREHGMLLDGEVVFRFPVEHGEGDAALTSTALPTTPPDAR
ncbi:MAG: septum formation initiator family protein [Myxococcales bacterium]|nr:septum formation initiator family protein [Myxococcales bacterium]